MGRYVLKRLLQGALVVFFVTVVVFVTTRMVGDPVDVLLPFESTPDQPSAGLGSSSPNSARYLRSAARIAVRGSGVRSSWPTKWSEP